MSNAEATIHKCVNSILDQTFRALELLLINDGSKDKSLNILMDYEKTYSFIKLADKANEGASLTRNRGLELAKGDFIVFIDSDDFIDKDYLETMYQAVLSKKM